MTGFGLERFGRFAISKELSDKSFFKHVKVSLKF